MRNGEGKTGKKERPNERNCHAQILLDNDEDEDYEDD